MSERRIRLVIPTGRLNGPVLDLLSDSGFEIPRTEKNYRPRASDPRFEIKLLKAANIPRLVELGAHDVGFSGLDWIQESEAAVETLLDTGLLPVRVVSAAPAGMRPFDTEGGAGGRPLVVASEYERLTAAYMQTKNVPWHFVRTWGTTEVFPPEDADLIVDNTATGSALAANGLTVIDELLRSTAVLIANRESLADPLVREPIEDLVLLLRSVLTARDRVLLEMNVGRDRLPTVIDLLPAMKSPTVQPLSGDGQYAVKAAVPSRDVHRLVPMLRRAGATDILETAIRRVIP